MHTSLRVDLMIALARYFSIIQNVVLFRKSNRIESYLSKDLIWLTKLQDISTSVLWTHSNSMDLPELRVDPSGMCSLISMELILKLWRLWNAFRKLITFPAVGTWVGKIICGSTLTNRDVVSHRIITSYRLHIYSQQTLIGFRWSERMPKKLDCGSWNPPTKPAVGE